ncbi:hypothetical protein [Arcobacter sp. FWKO B]|uniref:hypothetical protein n=1 Tax=Arcobacter sp. FWKO B TaxID=2593672 RepID=UPI0018A43CBC|nr:hypothetical protein [Arcobacter sp. FWKO B]QOG11709.1 hypothetical protein FWKOB_02885 [Arcobacter sp. FWKO B]
MKLTKIVLAGILSVSIASANDVMKKSMDMMEKGMTNIQIGFMHNNEALIRDGLKLVKEGNAMFSDKKVIANYLPEKKKHMVNVAETQAKRIALDANVLEVNLDQKSYMDAANAYSDILNACSRCHAIVREW